MPAKLLAALLTLTAVPALAQSTEPARYQLISVSGGFVRLDMVSGVMTFCRDEVDSFRCAPISAGEADRLQPEAGMEPKRDKQTTTGEDKTTGEREGRLGVVPPDDQDRERDMAGRHGGERFERKDERGFHQGDSLEDFYRALSMMQRAMRGFMALSRENPRDCTL